MKSLTKLAALLLTMSLLGGTAFAAVEKEAAPVKAEAVKQEAVKAEVKEVSAEKPALTVEAPKPEAVKIETPKTEAPKKAKAKAKKENTLKKYVKKGKLTEAEAAKIKDEIKNELKNEIISEIKAELKSELAPEVKEAVNTDIKAAIAADKSKEVEIAKKDKENELKITGYTQVRYTDDNTPGAAGSSWNSARTRLIMNKKHDDKLSFFAQTNMSGNSPATATNSNDWKMTLLDASIAYKPTPDWEIRAGQFIVPFGLEVPLGPKNLYLVNYSQVGSNSQHEVAGDDSRDMGVQFKYNQKNNPFTYYISATNGEGINRKNDSNDDKNIVGRVTYAPDKFWQFGA
ncbi:MAG TPA: porin, partial [Candidatus Wallbacteria bacterium]|nr:porin [Candidatus Wallbacteria bacterium]